MTAAAAGLAWGCAGWRLPGARPRLPDCPGALVATRAIPGDFQWRERVRYRGDGDGLEASLELVVEKRGDALVLVGFNELGAKAFAVTQRGIDTEVRSFLGPTEVVPPLDALRDLHRARLASGRPPLAPVQDVTLRPPGCGYAVTFARLSARALE